MIFTHLLKKKNNQTLGFFFCLIQPEYYTWFCRVAKWDMNWKGPWNLFPRHSSCHAPRDALDISEKERLLSLFRAQCISPKNVLAICCQADQLHIVSPVSPSTCTVTEFPQNSSHKNHGLFVRTVFRVMTSAKCTIPSNMPSRRIPNLASHSVELWSLCSLSEWKQAHRSRWDNSCAYTFNACLHTAVNQPRQC